MSTRHLDALLNPASVVVVGASARADSPGGAAWRNLRAGAFKGAVYALNPEYRRLDGQSVYARIDELPAPAELALLCTPAADWARQVEQLGRGGTRAVVVLGGAADAAQRQALLDAARLYQVRVLGPGSSGVLSPHLGMNASTAQGAAAAGELALLSHSRSLMAAMLDWALERRIGFSHLVSLGERGDVDSGDLLDYLGSDARTRAILLCIDEIDAPRKFLSAARAAARNKPVIVVRWRAPGAPERSERVFDAAVARSGMLRVATLQDMLLAAETLVRFRTNRSERLLIVGNGRGAAALAAQAAARAGVALAAPPPASLPLLQPLLAPPPAATAPASSGTTSAPDSPAMTQTQPAAPPGPLLLRADAAAQPLAQALQQLAEAADAPAMLLVHAPAAHVSSAQLAHALLPLAQLKPPRLIGCWLGHSAAAEARRVFQHAGIPSYETPEDAVQAFAMLVSYRRHQAQLIEAPPLAGGEVDADAAGARALVQAALAAGRTLLDVDEARTLLGRYGIAVRARQRVPPEPYAAASAAEKTGYPAMLKVISPDIAPGFDGDTMVLDLRHAVQVLGAATRMLGSLRRRRPGARVEGFSVEAMAQPLDARALSAGARIDERFGPVLWLAGSENADVDEATVTLPPLNAPLARAALHRSGVAAQLRAHGDVAAADAAALQRVLVGLSQLLSDVSQLAEISLSPLLVGSDGALAVRARVRLSLAAPAGALNFAIRPYPSQLVETLPWLGRPLTLRPIRPEDEAQHTAFLSQLTPEDIRMRLFYSRRGMERSELARLTQIDYAREMAIIATDVGPDGAERTLGVVRAIADPDNASAEFGIVIRSDMKGQKLGPLLMQRIIDYQRSRGTAKLVASVLAENTRMLALVQRLGFVEGRSDEPGVRYVELAL